MSRPVVLVAAGGLARETLEAVRAGDGLRCVGVLDDDPALAATRVLGVPVLGGLPVLGERPDVTVVLCAGAGSVRGRLATRLGLGDERYATVVHPSVSVPASCTVGAGSILLAGVVLTASVTIGRHVAVMPHVSLTHDVVVEDCVTLCAGASVAGSVRLGAGSYVGMHASIREGLVVGAGATVGMGAVVLGDVPAGETWVGNPARPLAAVERRRRLAVHGGRR